MNALRIIARAMALPAVVVFALQQHSSAASFADDFDDGNDTGWTHYDPLAGLGVGGAASWGVSDGVYRLQASGATAGTFGPARVGSFRTDLVFAEFVLAFDLVNWAADLDQIFGSLARVNQLSIGAVQGYAFTYATRFGRNPAGELEILRVGDEAGTTLTATDLALYPTNSYRFVFTGLGDLLTGQVFQLPDTSTPIATISVTDSTYTSGFSGVFTYDNSASELNPVDFTVDNISSLTPQPSLNLSLPSGGLVRVTWPIWASSFDLQFTTTLTNPEWSTVPAGQDGTSYFFEEIQAESGFFRLRSR